MKKSAFTLSTVLAAALAFLWLGISVEASSEAGIEDLGLRVEGDQAKVTFRLTNAFDEDFERRIQSGLPTELTFRFVLERERKTWFDKSVARGSLQVIAMYNAVTSEYLVNFKQDGDLIESRVVREPADLRSAMTELEAFPIFSVAGRNPEELLQLRVRAELGTRMLLAFIPRTVATEWAHTDRFRLNDLPR